MRNPAFNITTALLRTPNRREWTQTVWEVRSMTAQNLYYINGDLVWLDIAIACQGIAQDPRTPLV